ncbi:hypothetical protein HU200_056659 [Digitaria exilis]|uniref:F-box domain-containing protein n=1 Tax=Digitaria exilis TaxID=1010633 RepID=A0A835AIE5_9POAL|nr:hypothetical protein HU200_056659 [Digitaria exilis]
MEAAVLGTELPELPVEILVNILALLDIPDLVCAGSVCSSWNAAYTSLRSLGMYRRPQTPCLLYTSESDGDNVACLYSLAEKRVYKLTLPEPPICSRYLIGSTNGWLVTADDRSELHMINPITSEQIGLPSVTTIEQVEPIFDEAGAIQRYEFSQYYGEEEFSIPSFHALHELRDYLYVKAFVFTDSTSGSYTVVLIHNPIGQLSFAKAGDRKVIIDRTKDYIYEHMYLIQAPSGDLLQVWREQDRKIVAAEEDEDAPERDHDPSEIFMETRKIMLYKVHMDAKELVEMSSLHDLVLFLGLSQSHCLSTGECPQLKANHVYLTDDGLGFALRKQDCRDIGVFNLDNNNTEEVVSPQLLCSWPAPIWITPSLSNVSSGWNNICARS